MVTSLRLEATAGHAVGGGQPFTLILPEAVLAAIAEHAAALALERLEQRSAHGPDNSPFLTIKEAAGYLRCKRSRIDNLLSEGRLTRYKDGARTLIRHDELDRHLAGVPVGPNAGRLSTARGGLR